MKIKADVQRLADIFDARGNQLASTDSTEGLIAAQQWLAAAQMLRDVLTGKELDLKFGGKFPEFLQQQQAEQQQ